MSKTGIASAAPARSSFAAWTVAAVVLVVAVSAAAPAAAEIEVHVRNCTRSKLKVEAYDAKDSAETVPASHKTFDGDHRGQTHLFRCKGEGRGYCKVRVFTRSGADSDACIADWGGEGSTYLHIESGHRADVIGFTRGDDDCVPVVRTEDLAEDCNYDYD